jgi:hypothetical protein
MHGPGALNNAAKLADFNRLLPERELAKYLRTGVCDSLRCDSQCHAGKGVERGKAVADAGAKPGFHKAAPQQLQMITSDIRRQGECSLWSVTGSLLTACVARIVWMKMRSRNRGENTLEPRD